LIGQITFKENRGDRQEANFNGGLDRRALGAGNPWPSEPPLVSPKKV